MIIPTRLNLLDQPAEPLAEGFQSSPKIAATPNFTLAYFIY